MIRIDLAPFGSIRLLLAWIASIMLDSAFFSPKLRFSTLFYSIRLYSKHFTPSYTILLYPNLHRSNLL